jgi:putative nucleotidyltransferase with HDIG domain
VINRYLEANLLNQEKQAIKLFIYLFYLTGISYDVIIDFIFPFFTQNEWPVSGLFEIASYIIQLSLLGIAYYFLRRNRPAPIKYVFFTVYTLLNLMTGIVGYYREGTTFTNSNIAELVIVLFSPIFIDATYSWVVSVGTVLKYLVIGLVTGSPEAFKASVVVILISFISFIMLARFKSYLGGMKLSFAQHMEGIVKGIIATLELKDPYTRGHSERVAQYALLLANKTGQFTDDELKSFYYACLLHDIGKVQIPDHILAKPTELTNEEYEIIKKHTSAGAEAIQEIEGLQDCIEVVLYHHERWDGNGYPTKLKGTAIPLLARITSIADAFDAMTTIRSYRPALAPDEAYKRIVQAGGTQFDPQLVDVFKQVYESWRDLPCNIQWKVNRELIAH